MGMSRCAAMAAAILLGILWAGTLPAQSMKSGAWKAIPKDKCKEYTGNECWWENWKPLKKEAGTQVLQWVWASPDKEGGAPAKFIVMFGKEDNGWYKSFDGVKKWFSCQGEGQLEFIVETAADVHWILDKNQEAGLLMWVAVEYQKGKRLPFAGDNFYTQCAPDKVDQYAALNCAVQMPMGYKWEKKNMRSSGNDPGAMGDLGKTEWRIVSGGKMPEFKGYPYFFDKWPALKKGANPAVFDLGMMRDSDIHGKVVKYVLYFGEDSAKEDWVKSPGGVLPWANGKGEGQLDFYIECGSDVHWVVDESNSTYKMWVACEFENGVRWGFGESSFQFVKDWKKGGNVTANTVHLPENWNWRGTKTWKGPPAGAGGAQFEKVLDKAAFPLYHKEGRSWTYKMTTTMSGNTTIMYMKYEILKVTDTYAEVRTTMMDKDKKNMMDPTVSKTEFYVMKPLDDAPPTGDAPKVETGEETIKVEAGEFECQWSISEASGMKTKAWSSKKVQGLAIKSKSESKDMVSEMELVEWKDA